MTTSSLISDQLRRQSVVAVESTIPPEMTIAEWRRCRCTPAVPTRRVARLPAFRGAA